MASLPHHYLTMAYNNAWANHRLLKACSQLSQADFAAPRTNFFPSIKATLNHILTADWFYLDAFERSLQGQPMNEEPWQFFEPEEPFDTCTELWQQQRTADQRLIDLCQLLTDDQMAHPVRIQRPYGTEPQQLSRLLAHLFQHQIHHRGQVHAMLAGTSVEPPQLDEFFCEDEVALRSQDFQELGFSEQAIWQS